MSLVPNSNSSSPATSAAASTVSIARFPPPNYNVNQAANAFHTPIPFGVPIVPNMTSFLVPTRIIYEFNPQPAASTHLHSFVNSGTANSVSFHGLLNDGARSYFLSHQQNMFSFGTLAPRAPAVPFFSAMAPSRYELGSSSHQAPRGMSSSISLGGRRRPREVPLMRQTPDAVAREIIAGEHRCHECGQTFRSGPALGGHMSHHSKRRRQERGL